jgi:hypothetical protein
VADARTFVRAVEEVLAGLPENLCRQTTAKLVQLNLPERRKRISSRVITHLDDEQLEEFFQNAATTLYQRPSTPPVTDNELNAFVIECDTGLQERLD